MNEVLRTGVGRRGEGGQWMSGMGGREGWGEGKWVDAGADRGKGSEQSLHACLGCMAKGGGARGRVVLC